MTRNDERSRELRRLHAAFLADPNSVDPDWQPFFRDLAPSALTYLERAPSGEPSPAATPGLGTPPQEFHERSTRDSIRALMLIRAYRIRGHLHARLDPLELTATDDHPELDPASYGFREEDYDRPIFIDHVLGLERGTLREILDILKETYSSTIGVQFMHIQDPERKAWIQRRIEHKEPGPDFTDLGKRAILERLTDAEVFERFLDRKFTGTKRFGLDGGEAMVPALEQIIKRGGAMGLQELVIGMPHRGRLNVLGNVMNKPLAAIFAEFRGGTSHPDGIGGGGDVKYHLGTSSDRTIGDVTMHLSLTANPSHLEAVNPVVVGKVRAKQDALGSAEARERIGALLLHGDAAFAGQGLVAETLDLSQLAGYRIGGTIHFIVNNQIGFTTNPVHSRSSPYCSDVGLMIQAPLLHVNGDDPEAVVYAARVAIEYRQKFQSDVVVDMFCYRRHGHNEGDEPAFTQPIMYRRIAEHPTTRELYAKQLVSEKVIEPEEPAQMVSAVETRLEQALEASAGYRPNKADWLEGAWKGFTAELTAGPRGAETGFEPDKLLHITRRVSTPPDDFTAHPRVLRQLKRRIKAVEEDRKIDWATAEMLAFGTLLVEGAPVRISGQDSGRGTFSQRHAVLVDQKSERQFVGLNAIEDGQARFDIIDSPLAEASVLGFEYGYSLSAPESLVIWEAQFGDFANGAQVIIDQFLSSGESKWLRMSGLTMLLPHGYEGQGPEHSSARVERFLTLCAEDNMQVVNCTTPANYFHVLRRQHHRRFRKPLVVFTPKSLLRHKDAMSSLEAFGPGEWFHRVLPPENDENPEDAMRIVLCSGKVYYDLMAQLRGRNDEHRIRVVRVEQLYPFPEDAVERELRMSPKADVVWCQEEPKNMGPWRYIRPLIEEVMEQVGLPGSCRYVGRPESASTATGHFATHTAQQQAVVGEALELAAPIRKAA